MQKYRILDYIRRMSTGVTINDLTRLGYKFNTVRNVLTQFEKEGVLSSKKIGATKLYFLPLNDKTQLLIDMIKESEHYNLPLDLLFNNKELFENFYCSVTVSKNALESKLNLTNASVLINKLNRYHLIRVIKKRPLEFCFKPNSAIERFLNYLGRPVSRRVRYTLNPFNISYLSPSKIGSLETLKSEFYNTISSYSSRTDAFDRFMVYFVYNSCGIEGNKIQLRDTPPILKEGRIPTNTREIDYIDYLNSQDIISKVLIGTDFKRDIDHDLIKEINKKILDRLNLKAGEYRYKGQDHIPFGSGFASTPGEYVQIDMDLLIKMYYGLKQEGIHPLIIATIFHHKFEKIHPFFDGNGRTGRILVCYILIRAGFPPLIVEKRNKRRYYSALIYADEHAKDFNDTNVEAYKKLFAYFFKQIESTFNICFRI